MWFIREKPINTLGPGWDELLDYLRTLPNSNLRLNLDNLVDEYVLEHVPVNDLAHEQIVAYRASPRKDYEVIIHINEEENEVEILLSLIKVKR